MTFRGLNQALAGTAVFGLLASVSTARDAVHWPVEAGGNGHWYQTIRVASGEVSWSEAKVMAEQMGGHLATITSAQEDNFVKVAAVAPAAVGQGPFELGGPFIGGYQDPNAPDYSEPGGGWRWVTGEPWSYTGWGGGEPFNATPEEDYLQYWRWCCLWWNDTWDALDTGIATFVVEWEADCNGDGIVDFGQILSGALLDIDANGIPDVCEPPLCPGDLITDGVVDGVDLAALLGAWGSSGGPWNADVTMDGIVDAADLAVLLGSWGECG